LVVEYLEGQGFELRACQTVAEGLALTRREPFDAVLLDVMLPDGDGFDLCRTLRAESNVPIIMLTARGDETDRIVGLEIGADDYLPKPFNPRELLARIRAVLRRRTRESPTSGELLQVGSLHIDRERREVRVGERVASLTHHQFELLRILAEHAGRPVSRDRLMEEVGGDRVGPFDRSIDVHISRIRAAIEDDPKKPTRILTVRGVGYQLAPIGEVP
jgi:DNA-binding response OmpR family regulator